MSDLCDRDFYRRANEQAALPRAGMLSAADIETIAAEIESPGRLMGGNHREHARCPCPPYGGQPEPQGEAAGGDVGCLPFRQTHGGCGNIQGPIGLGGRVPLAVRSGDGRKRLAPGPSDLSGPTLKVRSPLIKRGAQPIGKAKPKVL